jgi:WbqC-like protein family
MKAVVLQSNYIPWKGYFDLIACADVFVVYDSVQYTKNDWRNRNRIMTKSGPVWLTLPIATAGRSGQIIKDACLSDLKALPKHLVTLHQTYGGLAGFKSIERAIVNSYSRLIGIKNLHEINVVLLKELSALLGIKTAIIDDSQFVFSSTNPTQKLVDICFQLGADTYVTGPAGLNYLEINLFDEADIQVEVIRYDGYTEYRQLGPSTFEHGVSVIDLIANVGLDAAKEQLIGRTAKVRIES